MFHRQQIANGLWPTTWSNLLAAVFIFAGVLHFHRHHKIGILEPVGHFLWALGDLLYLDEHYPYNFRVVTIAVLAGVVFFIVLLYLRQYVLRMLLAYRGWMCKLNLLLFSNNLIACSDQLLSLIIVLIKPFQLTF